MAASSTGTFHKILARLTVLKLERKTIQIGVIPSSTSNSKILLPYLSAYLSV